MHTAARSQPPVQPPRLGGVLSVDGSSGLDSFYCLPPVCSTPVAVGEVWAIGTPFQQLIPVPANDVAYSASHAYEIPLAPCYLWQNGHLAGL